MSDQEPPTTELEQLLRDERALRIRAETRAAEQAEKTQIWRTRAEERAARIEALTSQRRRGRWRKAADKPAPGAAPAATTPPAAVTPARLAAVRVAGAVRASQARKLAAFAVDTLSRNSLAEADLVVVDDVTLAKVDEAARRAFAEWLEAPARQPLAVVVTDASDPNGEIVAAADVLLASDAAALARFSGTDRSLIACPDVFDASEHNPMGRSWAGHNDLEHTTHNGITVAKADGDLVAIESAPPSFPPGWMIEAAACGIPITTKRLDLENATEPARAGVAARRWAFGHHTVELRGREIAAGAGVSVPDPRPHAAAILVSMRPDQAVAALEMMGRQTYQPLSVVVGIHGAAPTPRLRRLIDELTPTTPVELLTFPSDVSLGECLNRAIATSGAEVLVKIDDDDFYGPGHIEDGIHALRYSGAGIVGKGAQFTYVAEQDVTALRRIREEETFIGGSPTGATMFIRRSVWEHTGFPHRPRQVDVLFTRAARHNGCTVYANSRWDFCYIRHAQGHTWTTPTATFLAGSEPQWDGFHPDRMVVPSLAAPS